jgi:uncharacterized membrane protein
MDSKERIYDIFNKIFWIAVIFIFISGLYYFFEPKLVPIFKNKEIVTSTDTVNELTDAIKQYVDSINYKHYQKANINCSYLNEKSTAKYDQIYNKINTDSEYKIILKYVYKITSNTYRCYALIQDVEKDDYNYITNPDGVDIKSMYEFTVRLDLKNTTFKIIYDNLI